MSGTTWPTHHLTDERGQYVRDLTAKESAAYVERTTCEASLGCGVPSLPHDTWKRAKRYYHGLATHEERRALHRWLDLFERRIVAHTWETIAEHDSKRRAG